MCNLKTTNILENIKYLLIESNRFLYVAQQVYIMKRNVKVETTMKGTLRLRIINKTKPSKFNLNVDPFFNELT